jgi:hypothetical protein
VLYDDGKVSMIDHGVDINTKYCKIRPEREFLKIKQRARPGSLSPAFHPRVAPCKVRLTLLRQHPVLGLEVMPGEGDELTVAWMIDGFDAGNNLHQPGCVLLDVLDQRVFGIAGPGNENRAGVRNRADDCLKEIVILCGVPAAD